MFILSAYVHLDKHSLTFRHYSGMSAPYPKPFKPPSWVWTHMPMPNRQSVLQLSWDGMGDVHQGLSLSPPTPSTAMSLRWCRTVRGSIGESLDQHCCSNITPTWLAQKTTTIFTEQHIVLSLLTQTQIICQHPSWRVSHPLVFNWHLYLFPNPSQPLLPWYCHLYLNPIHSFHQLGHPPSLMSHFLFLQLHHFRWQLWPPLLPLPQYQQLWWIIWMCSTHCITDTWRIARTHSWHFLRAY